MADGEDGILDPSARSQKQDDCVTPTSGAELVPECECAM